MRAFNFRNDFPALTQKIYGKPLVYLDNAATTQRLKQVLDTYNEVSTFYNGNIHRSPHFLGQKATQLFENTRDAVQKFINAESRNEIIFTRGTTESINLVAFSYGETFIKQGDEIIVSEMEHHSNIVPWQMLCERKQATLRVIPFNDKGELEIQELDNLICDKTKLIAVTHASNVLGTINPIEEIIKKAHEKGVHVLIDAAQSIAHTRVDVQKLECDFLVFSAHKMYGPTGAGVLYGKELLLEQMEPYQGGGEMIHEVSFEKTTYGELPTKFEAGTPDFNTIAAFGKAIEYLQDINFEQFAIYEKELLSYAQSKLETIKGIQFYGEASQKTALISFTIERMHPFDTGTLLDKLGIAIRTGHMCADPIMQHYNIDSMMRISFSPYNTKEEIDILYDGLVRIQKMFA